MVSEFSTILCRRSCSEMLGMVLTQDVNNLGIQGQVVQVRPGYARNVLVPRRWGVYATPENRKVLSDVIAAADAKLAAKAEEDKNAFNGSSEERAADDVEEVAILSPEGDDMTTA